MGLYLKLYYKSDIKWKLDQAIEDARESGQVLTLIELDQIESREFLDIKVELYKQGLIRTSEYTGYTYYRNIQISTILK